jgi:broad specificity phosphatase PhoE
VLSSDLPRALETARIAGLDARPDPRWREVDIGAWEGLTREEVRERYADDHARIASGEPIPMGGAESWADLTDRIGQSMAELAAELPDGSRVAIMAHGGVIRAALLAGFRTAGHPLPQAGIRAIGPPRNTGMTEVSIGKAGEFHLASYNDASHLPAEPFDGPIVVLVRHGESEANVAGTWHGRTDGPLSAHGRAQAAALGDRYEWVDRVYASPLERARLTADALARANGLTVETRDDLVEVDLGEWEGLTGGEIAAGHPELWSAVFERGEDLPRGGSGETFEAAGRRLRNAIDDVVARHPGERLALVSHGGLIFALATRILQIDWRGFRCLGFPANAAVSHVRVANGSFVLADYNTHR